MLERLAIQYQGVSDLLNLALSCGDLEFIATHSRILLLAGLNVSGLSLAGSPVPPQSPPAQPPPSPPPSIPVPAPTGGGSSNTGPIVGGVVGGVAAIALAG